MSRLRRVLVIVALAAVASCVRAGFDVRLAADAGAGEAAVADVNHGRDSLLGKAADRCESPLTVSVGASFQIPFDTAGAVDDHHRACCFGEPELALVPDPPGRFRVTCTGGGKFSVFAERCPPPEGGACFVGLCNGDDYVELTVAPSALLYVCRRPDEGRALLLLERAP